MNPVQRVLIHLLYFITGTATKILHPIIGTILPCNLQPGKQYIFKGWISAKLNTQLPFKPGICIDQNFYVPKRPFSKVMNPKPIVQLKPVPETAFYEFEYTFTANGNEQYLTFGTFITDDTVNTNRRVFGTQTVSLMLDNFSLT